MFEVIAYSESFIYVLDRRNKSLKSWQLNHSSAQITNDSHALPKVKNFTEAEAVLADALLVEQAELDW